MSITTAQAVTLLEYVLFESPAAANANAANWAQAAGVDMAAASMSQSLEGGIADQVVRYYEGTLGRTPAGSEIAYYVAVAETGLSASQLSSGAALVPQATWNQIAADFTASPEFAASVKADPAGLVDMLYHNVLGRAPATVESAYYQAQLQNGADASLLVQEFVNSPEYGGKVNPTIQQTLAGYGAGLVPTGGPTPPSTSSNLLVQLFTVPSAGATYATAPTAVAPREGAVGVSFSADPTGLILDTPVDLGGAVTTVPAILAKLESGLAAHHAAYGVYEGNTFVVESVTGTIGSADTSVVEITGTYNHVEVVSRTIYFSV